MAEPAIERRLAAVVTADVVGYSRLMGVDEAGTLSRLKSFREAIIQPRIAAYHGRIVKLMGDGILLEFPSIVDALSCAVELQRTLGDADEEVAPDKRIQFRIGINLGDIIVQDNDIYGDGVNIAARLEPLAEPGGICLSQAARDALGNKLPLEYEYLGAQTLKNIAESVNAYRVIVPSGAVMPEGDSSGQETIGKPEPRPTDSRFRIVTTVIVLLLGAAGSFLWWRPDLGLAERSITLQPLPDRPSIAVLPFNNMSADPEQEYFADGISEDIITDLSKISGLFVVARNSSFTYKGTSVRLKQVGKELGVRYILEGSIRRAGNQVRINAQLIDANTETHLWAERYDGSLENIFAIQDKVTELIVSALSVHINAEERILVKKIETPDIDAYDMFLHAREVQARFTPNDNAAGRRLFEQATQIDPAYARAYANIALTHAIDLNMNWSQDREQSIRKGQEAIDRARYLDPDVPQIYFAQGTLLLAQGRYDEAIRVEREAIKIAPNYADGHAQLAFVLVNSGQHAEGLDYIDSAKRLNPYFSLVYLYVESIGLFHLERYQDVVDLLESAVARNPAYDRIHLMLAASYAKLGRHDDAEWSVQEAEALIPGLTLTDERNDSVLRRSEDIERYIDGLREAGLAD